MILPQEIRHKAKEYTSDQKIRQAFCDGAITYAEYIGRQARVVVTEDVVVEDVSFEAFWKAYDKKVAKEKSMKLWHKLSKKEKAECMAYVPHYVEASPDKQYRKNPDTFLRNKCWHDEIINRNNRPKQLSPEEQEREYLNSLAQDLFAGRA